MWQDAIWTSATAFAKEHGMSTENSESTTRLHMECLKNQFATELTSELGKARVAHDEAVRDLRKEFDGFRAGADATFRADTLAHRGFLQTLEDAWLKRAKVLGAAGVAVTGIVVGFVLKSTYDTLDKTQTHVDTVLAQTRAQTALDLKATEEKLRLELKTLAKDFGNQADAAVKNALQIDKLVKSAQDALLAEFNQQSASTLLAELFHAKREVENAASADPDSVRGLEPEPARALITLIDGIVEHYLGQTHVETERRDALLMVAGGIVELAHANKFRAEQLLKTAMRRYPKFADPYLLLTFTYTLDYEYQGGGNWDVEHRKERDLTWEALTKLEPRELDSYSSAQRGLAYYAREKKDYAGALKILEADDARNPHPETRRQMALCAWLSGDEVKAVSSNFNALNLEPKATTIQNDLLFMLTHIEAKREQWSLENAGAHFGSLERASREVASLAARLGAHPSGKSHHVYVDTLGQAWATLWLAASAQFAKTPTPALEADIERFALEAIKNANKMKAVIRDALKPEKHKYEAEQAEKILKLVNGHEPKP